MFNVEACLAHFGKMLWQSQLLAPGFSQIFWKEGEIWTLSRASPEAEVRALTLQELGADWDSAVAVAKEQWGLCAVKDSPQVGLGREERKETSLKNSEETIWVQGQLWEIVALQCRIEGSPPLPTRNTVGSFVF